MRAKRLSFILLFSTVIFLLHSGFLETTSGLNQKGNKAFQEKRYQTALDAYQKAQVRNPDHPTIRYNVGTALYQMDQFQEAETQLAQGLANAKTKELKALAHYNYGNTQYRLGQFDKAIESYRKTLDLNPHDKDAKYNLELLQKKKSLFEMKQDKRDENRKNQPPPSQQDREQQQQSQGKDKKDQQSQNQEGQEQNPGQQRDQDKKEEQPSQGQEDEKEQEKEEESGQNQSQKQDQKEQQKPEPEQGQEFQAREEEGKGQKNEREPSQPEEREGSQEQKPEEGQGEQLKPLFQGQMSKENAIGILDALKSSEQELQSLRRPRQQAEHEPLKDW